MIRKTFGRVRIMFFVWMIRCFFNGADMGVRGGRTWVSGGLLVPVNATARLSAIIPPARPADNPAAELEVSEHSSRLPD